MFSQKRYTLWLFVHCRCAAAAAWSCRHPVMHRKVAIWTVVQHLHLHVAGLLHGSVVAGDTDVPACVLYLHSLVHQGCMDMNVIQQDTQSPILP